MLISLTVFWAILAAVFMVIEIATISLVSIWFFLGALVALVLSFYHFALWTQVTAFFVVSILFFAILYPIVKRKIHINHTNIDTMIGSTGIVSEEIDNLRSKGRVFVNGKSWAASSVNGEAILVGEKVEVLAIQGVHLVVEKKEKEES